MLGKGGGEDGGGGGINVQIRVVTKEHSNAVNKQLVFYAQSTITVIIMKTNRMKKKKKKTMNENDSSSGPRIMMGR